MLEKLRIDIGYWFFKDQWHKIVEKENQLDQLVNMRVATVLAKMDPFEPLMHQFRGIFSEEFEKPEDRLDPQSNLRLIMWAYQQTNDPQFNYLMNWVIDTQANATLKKGNPTPETILYGRAQISAPILIKREISRLGLLYEELLKKQKGEEFEENLSVE